jgi:hypothetical protein
MLRRGSLLIITSAIVLALLLALSTLVVAQEAPSQIVTGLHGFQYAAKVLCTSNIPGTSQTTPSVLPGTYQTAVNIHNPSNRATRLRMKLVVSAQVSSFVPGTLEADAARSVDCEEIRTTFGPFIHGVEGFLVIQSPSELDVIAVYTAGGTGSDGHVQSIAVEQIRERRMW